MEKRSEQFKNLPVLKKTCRKAVLVAIAIPVFTSQLEKSRESTDAANLRAAYAEVMAAAITGETDTASGVTVNKDATTGAITTVTKTVDCKQQVQSWQNTSIEDIGGVAITSVPASALTGWTITYTASTNAVTFAE